MGRMMVPPMALACAPMPWVPRICLRRTHPIARLVDLVRLLPLACPVSGLPRLPLPRLPLPRLALAVNVAGQLSGFQHRFDLGRPAGGIRPHPGALPQLQSAGQSIRALRVEPQNQRRAPSANPHPRKAPLPIACHPRKPAPVPKVGGPEPHLNCAAPMPANPPQNNPTEAQPPNPSQTSPSLQQ